MMMRYLDRREHIRVPARGPAWWRSGNLQGHCELLDISPAGAGLRMSMRKAKQLGPRISVEVEIQPGETWYVTRCGRVVRHTPDTDGMCRVGIAFEPDSVNTSN